MNGDGAASSADGDGAASSADGDGAASSADGDETSTGPLARFRSALEGELGRRLVHAGGVGIPLTYYVLAVGLSVEAGLAWRVLQAMTVVGVVAGAALEIVRLNVGLDWWLFEHLTREYEAEKVAGYALYLVGMAAVAVGFPAVAALAGVSFPIEAALTGLFLLSLGDPLSGYAAEDTPGAKGPRAIVPALLVGTAIGLLVGLRPVAAVAAAVGLVVADVRLWSIRGYVIDDNLTIPALSCALAWLVTAAV